MGNCLLKLEGNAVVGAHNALTGVRLSVAQWACIRLEFEKSRGSTSRTLRVWSVSEYSALGPPSTLFLGDRPYNCQRTQESGLGHV